MLCWNLRFKTLFFLNGIVYHQDKDNVLKRQEIALNQILNVVIINIIL